MFGWVWFRANSFAEAVAMFQSLLGLNGLGTMSAPMRVALSPFAIAALVVGMLLSLWKWRLPRLRQAARRLVGDAGLALGDNAWVLAVLILCILEVGANAYSPFLYYRF
jgi:alginate O-acetyltransferase complex protein AlgI